MANDSPAKSLVDIDLASLRVSVCPTGASTPHLMCSYAEMRAGGCCERCRGWHSPAAACLLSSIRWHGRPANRAQAARTSSEPDGKYYRESITPSPHVCLFLVLCQQQDPAGIFELVEVVGNGTYGQVYKVGVVLHLSLSLSVPLCVCVCARARACVKASADWTDGRKLEHKHAFMYFPLSRSQEHVCSHASPPSITGDRCGLDRIISLIAVWPLARSTSSHYWMCFSDANITPVHLFWSRGGPSAPPLSSPPSSSSSHPHPSKISLADCTLCIALIGPTPSVHDSLHHADRLVRHWVGGVSLRICAHHCPAGLLLEWLCYALMWITLLIPSHTHTHTQWKKASDGGLVVLLQPWSGWDEQRRPPALAW